MTSIALYDDVIEDKKKKKKKALKKSKNLNNE